MKKSIAALALMTIATQANADLLFGAEVEVNAWQQTVDVDHLKKQDDNTMLTLEVSLEHPIPLIPNAKIGQSTVDSEDLSYIKQDYTGYYEILDFNLITADAGVGVSTFEEGELKSQDWEGFLPHVYGRVQVGIPATPIYVFAKGYLSEFKDSSFVDASVGLKYELDMGLLAIQLQGGYRIHELSIDDYKDFLKVNGNVNGAFIGVNIDI